ncbi:methionine ABC transporter substrate-binding protein [Enterobacterales bacterium CwR94]|nr:methionine ABC transporter substrate-binding protein [Enterobacterales bacterium CwR94]
MMKKALVSLLIGGALAVASLPAFSQSDDKTIHLLIEGLKVYEDSAKVLGQELQKAGYTLEVQAFTNGVQASLAVEKGEADAGYHRHQASLNAFNAQYGTHLVAAFKCFTDPAGLFSKKYPSLQDLPDGATIAVHVEPANYWRPFLILQKAGLIRLRDGVKPTDVTEKDIIDNPKHLKFVALDYALLIPALQDVDASFLYSTQAAEIGLSYQDAIGLEDPQYQSPDVIYVQNGQQQSAKIQALEKAYHSAAVKQSLLDSYGGKPVLIPAW